MYRAVIVDDEPVIVEGLLHAIDWAGYNFEVFRTFTNPLQALDFCLEHHSEFDLLITDVSMPELSGIDLICRVKEHSPLLYVLILSAYDNFDYVRSALRYGAENYLLKPLDPDEFGQSIGQIVRHLQEREQLSTHYGLNMLTFRSNFTESWVKGDLSTNDLISRADFLGIDLEVKSYTVVIFSALDNNQARMSQFFDFLLTHLLGQYLGHFYFESPIELVCVLTSPTQENPPIADFLHGVLEDAQRHQYCIHIAYGSTVSHFESVQQSCREARRVLFLKHTPLAPLAGYQQCELSEAASDIIRQPYTYLDQELYAASLERLFAGARSEQAARTYAVAILSWFWELLGESRASLSRSGSELLAALAQFPATASTEQYRDYALRFVSLCHAQLALNQQNMYPCVNAVIDTIHSFSGEDLSLKVLAQRLNVSPSYLGNAFKLQTGYYFNDYLTNARLEYAARLLRETDLKIKDIVERVGFSSQTYFNRIFKRNYNLSPVAWRRRVKLGEEA